MSNLTTKQVNERLGLGMTAPFIIETLGVMPTEKVKNGYFWSEEAFTLICGQIIEHVRARALATPESCDDLFA